MLERPDRARGTFLPRYPYFIHPTVDDWYRTTVNPLVWAALPNGAKLDRYEPRYSALQSQWQSDGIWLEFTHWISSFSSATGIPIDRRIKYRPDALFDPRNVEELFSLLTSGRIDDRKLARTALEGMCTPYLGGGPEVEKNIPGFRVTKHAGPKPKRAGREKLAVSLGVQERVWTAKRQAPESSALAILRAHRVAEKGCSETTVRNHLEALADYRDLLSSSNILANAAAESYPDAPPEEWPTRSLADAIDWLNEERE